MLECVVVVVVVVVGRLSMPVVNAVVNVAASQLRSECKTHPDAVARARECASFLLNACLNRCGGTLERSHSQKPAEHTH